MKKRGFYVIAVLCIIITSAILLDQFLRYGYLLELKDVLHHEFFAFVFLAFALGIIFVTYTASEHQTTFRIHIGRSYCFYRFKI